MSKILTVIIVLYCYPVILLAHSVCQPGWVYGDNVNSCVVTSTHNDSVAKLPALNIGQVAVYQSAPGTLQQVGDRLQLKPLQSLKRHPNQQAVSITVGKQTEQTIQGFGGALTDAAAINLQRMPKAIRDAALQAYFGKNGIDYNMVRIPIAASDYSTHYYTYLDKAPQSGIDSVTYVKNQFQLASEDIEVKIPLLKDIHAMSQYSVKLFASPWTAPAWMKTDEAKPYIGGNLNPKDFAAWAEYLHQFIQAYKNKGVSLWGMTIQNEPGDVMNLIASMGYQVNGQDQTLSFVQNNLAPMLKRYYPQLKLMVGDDEINNLQEEVSPILSNSYTNTAVSGIALHPYYEKPTWSPTLDQLHQQYRDKFLLSTEYSDFDMGKGSRQLVGDWHSAMDYAEKIIGLMNRNVSGFVDWNMVLDSSHGPDVSDLSKTQAPMIYDASSQILYKTPLYYVLGQFSTFVPANSQRLAESVEDGDDIQSTAFITPNRHAVVVVLNKANKAQAISINTGHGYIDNEIPAQAVQTYIYY